MRHLLNMFEIFTKFNAKFCALKGDDTHPYVCIHIYMQRRVHIEIISSRRESNLI